MVDIEDMTGGKPYVFDSFFDDGQGFQSQKVHLDQSGLFNYRTFILGYEHFFAGFLVFRGTYRYDIGYIVTTDNNTTGMYPGISYVTFQHLCIFQCVACQRIISGGSLFQFRYVVDCIFQFEFLHIRDLIRYQFCQAVRFGKWKFLYTGYVFDRRFGCHRTVSDNVGNSVGSVFFRYPA